LVTLINTGCWLQHHYHDRIAQLVYTFPEDALTSTGASFWSAPKRFPHALDFQVSNLF
jgi:ubiquitin-activating enzyme E1